MRPTFESSCAVQFSSAALFSIWPENEGLLTRDQKVNVFLIIAGLLNECTYFDDQN